MSPSFELKSVLPATKQVSVRVVDDLDGINQKALDISVLTNLSMSYEIY